MSFIAHVRSKDGEIQEVKTHLYESKELAEKWGEPIGLSTVCGLAAFLHDIGKLSDEFQEYIRKAVSGEKVRRGEVDHATAGGRLLFERLKGGLKGQLLAEVVSNAILSHHGNLLDYQTEDDSPFLERVERKALPSYEICKKRFFKTIMDETLFDEFVTAAVDELYEWLQKRRGTTENLTFVTKYIYSVLLDADRTNTRVFEENGADQPIQYDFEQLKQRLECHLITLRGEGTVNPINQLREQMSDACRDFARQPSGIYTLSIPTGGGKTLASLRYALHHATEHQKKRIIYIVPYTTIIEQNAAVVRQVLQTEEVLEHHSNIAEIDESSDDVMNMRTRLHLAKDNWDAPIIFTTMVQYLNTFYAKGNRNTRRLHHLSEAIIIFDEVQKVPLKCISLFNESVKFLKESLQSSIVLCTATQPALDFVEHHLVQDGEMINQLSLVHEAFKRTEMEIIDQEMDTQRLSSFVREKANEKKSILIILNTKGVAKNLYHSLKDVFSSEELIHLSTSMCAAHRMDTLSEVTQRLKMGKRTICVSTQLIEAGVDISFECVIRSLAGLDSIAQAAGRCNRNGETSRQTVYLIDHEEENLKHLPEIRRGKQIVRALISDLRRDEEAYDGGLLGQAAMTRYFQELYSESEHELRYPIKGLAQTLVGMLFEARPANGLLLSSRHRTTADHFHVIDQNTISVLVPYGEEGKQLIASLNGEADWEEIRLWLKDAQQYSINLYSYERDALEKAGGLIPLLDGMILVLDERAYDHQYGLNLHQDSILENYFI